LIAATYCFCRLKVNVNETKVKVNETKVKKNEINDRLRKINVNENDTRLTKVIVNDTKVDKNEIGVSENDSKPKTVAVILK